MIAVSDCGGSDRSVSYNSDDSKGASMDAIAVLTAHHNKRSNVSCFNGLMKGGKNECSKEGKDGGTRNNKDSQYNFLPWR